MTSFLELYSQHRYQDIINIFAKDDHFRFGENPLESKLFAASYFKIGEYQKAILILEELESVLFNDVEYLSLFGATLRRLACFEKAKKYFLRAIEIDHDSIILKNNYSNLLIDLGSIDEAINLLETIVANNPDYNDAAENLNRAIYIRDSSAKNLPRNEISQVMSTSTSTIQNDYFDPLSLAFTEEEVAHEYQRFSKVIRSHSKNTINSSSQLPVAPNKDLLSDLVSLAKQAIADKDYDLVFNLCSKIHSMSPPMSVTYSMCSDAFISSKKFHEAEICLLTSLLMSEPTPSQYINLSTFASLRRDFKLAYHYLNLAASIDPSHSNLDRVRKNLDILSSGSDNFGFKNSFNLTLVK